jgi:hypothetical protein
VAALLVKLDAVQLLKTPVVKALKLNKADDLIIVLLRMIILI